MFAEFFRKFRTTHEDHPGSRSLDRRALILGLGAIGGATLLGGLGAMSGEAKASGLGAAEIDVVPVQYERPRGMSRREWEREMRRRERRRERRQRMTRREVRSLCRGDRRFRRANPRLCDSVQARGRPGACVDFGPVTICD